MNLFAAKSTKVFPLFNRSKPPTSTQPSVEESAIDYPSSQPIEFLRSDDRLLQALEASKFPAVKSRVKKWKSAPSNDGKSNGSTAEDPIVLDHSPTRTRSLPVRRKPLVSRTLSKLKRVQEFGSLDVHLPSGESQHVRGPQSVFAAAHTDIPFKRRNRDLISSKSVGESSSLSLAGIIDYPRDSPIPPQGHSTPPLPPPKEPTEYQDEYPAFRVFTRSAGPPDEEQPSTDLWVRIWRPILADQVLGNEDNARYLRDWLSASKISPFSGSVDPSTTSIPASSSQPKTRQHANRGTKRPRIRREVENKRVKRRKRRELDWIVYDEESSDGEPHPLDAILDNESYSDALFLDEPALETEVPMVDLPPLVHDTRAAPDISNTIILCGPSGCGKSAAVFACIEELGWEVLEVYPGLSKRSGAVLDNLIGQVGRNHLARGRDSLPTPKNNVLARFLGVTATKSREEPSPTDASSSGTDIPDIGSIEIESDDGLGAPAQPLQDVPSPVPKTGQELETSQAKQLLILLEEVDILYKDDVNFWPTVINIIRECRRAVVLTCNGTWRALCSRPFL